MRRNAPRTDTAAGRPRQPRETAAAEAPQPPLVSILLVTRRPHLIESAVDAATRQTYPNKELVLGLHGDGFENAEALLGQVPFACRAVRIPASRPLGAALNAVTQAAHGALLTKMDDDDVYGGEHLWDLVHAWEHSGATLVGKGIEFVYLAGPNQTLHCFAGAGERFSPRGALAGGTLLIARQDLDRIGGWRPVRRHVDRALWRDVARAGGRIYRTHGTGFVLVRHGKVHTWRTGDGYFRIHATTIADGWQPAMAGVDDAPRPMS